MVEQLTPRVFVLDSWPILEWIKGRQPTAHRFRALLESAAKGDLSLHMTRINRGEVLYSLRKPGAVPDPLRASSDFFALPISVTSIDDALVDEATELKARYPFSYADAFAAAYAVRLGVPLVTGDKEFRALVMDGLLKLEWLGE